MTDNFSSSWIKEKAQEVLAQYSEGITLRQLYYRLVAMGMTNNINHYKKVVSAMTQARWSGIVDMCSFVDRERSMFGQTEADEKDVESEIERTKRIIKHCMESYSLERWSNQPKFVEVWIEKKALQGVFETPCNRMDVGLAPCKGYPSLTFLYEASLRFERAQRAGKDVIILYFGDYDPSGEDIPRSIEENLRKLGARVTVQRVALMPELIKELGLPGVPPKSTDSRTATWAGDEAVELDAVEPKMLQDMCKKAILEHFDTDLHQELIAKEDEERETYQEALKEFVNSMGDEGA